MKCSFMLPSCTYNIVLSKAELQQLLETGYISVNPMRGVTCHTGRAVYDSEKQSFKTLASKEISNNIRFYLDEDVADIEGGDWHVQFLNIQIEGFKKEDK